MTPIENAEQALRVACPSGHRMFARVLAQSAELHDDKNNDYASGGDPLGNFRRLATIHALYPNLDLTNPTVVIMLQMLKQIDATLWILNGRGELIPRIEGVQSRMRDINVFSALILCMIEDSYANSN